MTPIDDDDDDKDIDANLDALDPLQEIRTLHLDRKQQLKLFLSMVNSWGWVIGIPEEEEEGDVVGLVVGQPHWVKIACDVIASETGTEFVIPEKQNEPSQTH